MDTKQTLPFIAELVTSFEEWDLLDDTIWCFWKAVVQGVEYAYVALDFGNGVLSCWVKDNGTASADKTFNLSLAFKL